MNRSPEWKGELAKALAEARKNFKPLVRSKTVNVTGARGSYSFSYAPFEEVLDSVVEPLADQGLTLIQGAVGNELVTCLQHISGEWIESAVPLVIPQGSSPQQVASALTYAKRQGTCAILVISPDDDDDANAAEGNSVEVVAKGGQKASKTASPLEVQKAGCMAVFNQLGMTNDITREALRVKLMGDIKFNPNSITDWVQLLGLLQAHRDTINPARELEV